MIKVLNLYAGIGGNRKLWQDVDVIAVEMNKDIAAIYQDFFPNDKMIIGDAHQYLLDHYREFDFIWSSPPCPTHSIMNWVINAKGIIRYPDMSLYQEIIFLMHFAPKGQKWCIENVRSYYDPLIPVQKIGRHYFWANFYISDFKEDREFDVCCSSKNKKYNEPEIKLKLQEYYDIDIGKYKKTDKTKILRNCVYPVLGKHIFDCAFKNIQMDLLSNEN